MTRVYEKEDVITESLIINIMKLKKVYLLNMSDLTAYLDHY